MSTEQENKKENHTQTENNAGNIGRESGVENDEQSQFTSDGHKPGKKRGVNESGIAENEENHWSGDHNQREGLTDKHRQNTNPDQTSFQSGNQGRNHVSNAGGTSQEDLEKGKTGLTDEENQ
ncbi:MAG: hypothetical protein ABI390_03965 [Daejeonella sp.]